ncbi:class I SAM-dependent methyltransferase [Spirosoma telluris]|uniref:class I SAM-dependent methyltransferase n=1 Tax=Spirosoma telluris TaxID=2183553 RepID=UPI002FC3837D
MTGPERKRWIQRNRYYYSCLLDFLHYTIPFQSSVLEIGCGIGYVLDKLSPSRGVGIDINPEFIEYAQKEYPQYTFHCLDAKQVGHLIA